VLASRFPVHVTYRLVRRLPNARRPALFRAIRRAFNAGREAFGGRLCHFSVQKDHLHLIVEAANREALSRALQALAIRVARAINRVLGRKGKVFADRYHMRILKTPTEVKSALRYVLDNRWKHNPRRPEFFVEQDFCSSLAWLESAVVAPRTWLLRSAERALQLRREVQ
jgi:REP element-mobilizing transposase RayT